MNFVLKTEARLQRGVSHHQYVDYMSKEETQSLLNKRSDLNEWFQFRKSRQYPIEKLILKLVLLKIQVIP